MEIWAWALFLFTTHLGRHLSHPSSPFLHLSLISDIGMLLPATPIRGLMFPAPLLHPGLCPRKYAAIQTSWIFPICWLLIRVMIKNITTVTDASSLESRNSWCFKCNNVAPTAYQTENILCYRMAQNHPSTPSVNQHYPFFSSLRGDPRG